METKPQEAALPLSLLTRAKTKANPVPPIQRAVQEFWSSWRFVQVSNEFVLRSRLFPRAQSCVGV